MRLWPHQERSIAQIRALVRDGRKKIVLALQTGGGKSKIAIELIESFGVPTLALTNRRMLLDQWCRVLEQHGVQFGVRAAGVEKSMADVQLCSIQTLDSRVLKGNDQLPRAELVIIDEAHVNSAAVVQAILERLPNVILVGLTATPLGIGHLYDEMVQVATMPDLFESGALVPASHFGPDEPDTRKWVVQQNGEWSDRTVAKGMMGGHRAAKLFGRVKEHYHRLNPDQAPAILFGPDVAGSLWFAEQFHQGGISAAHIDGENIWINREWYHSKTEERDWLRREVECGNIQVVCNRFVMREGIDWPFLQHCILATAFGGVASYLQSGGRMLRAHPGKELATIQDHGGNWHRHGSLNSTRLWDLDDTNRIVTGLREKRLRESKEPEPICCPKCQKIRPKDKTCPFCGYEYLGRSRKVVQTDGSLKQMSGEIYRARRKYSKENVQEMWNRYYFRGRNAGMTFNQIEALFAKENYWQWPPRNLEKQPRRDRDWFLKVGHVSDLT